MYEKALAIRLPLLGEQHPTTATTLANIGRAYNALKAPTKALEFFERAVVSLEKTVGESHPETGRVYGSMGCAYLDLSLEDKGKDYLRRCIRCLEESLGPGHRDVVYFRNRLEKCNGLGKLAA
eukprot:m.3016 g.3016  ORF g.3016 m.3016 type:complete len:123 (-) comp1573_c0_seq1:114-482(-)